MEKLDLVSLPHFVSVENLSVEEVEALIKRAEYFKNGGATPRLTQPVYISNMFFEDSSRTHTSFEMAERKLGLTVIPFDPAHSSVNKGETLYDTSLIMDAVGVKKARMEQQVPSDVQPYSRNISSGAHPPPHSR